MRPKHTKEFHLEEEGSYLASVADVMSGLLYVFIITLVVFALNLSKQTVQYKEEVKELTNADKARKSLLEALENTLKKEGIRVQIDSEQGVLRLEDRVLFESGEAELGPEGQLNVSKLTKAMAAILPCFSDVDHKEGCQCKEELVTNSEAKYGKLDAIFVEGHTDNQPIVDKSRFEDNWELSTARAKSVYIGLTGQASENTIQDKIVVPEQACLKGLQNRENQPLLSLSGYGDGRPVASNDSEETRRKNRRIDLRFILVPTGKIKKVNDVFNSKIE